MAKNIYELAETFVAEVIMDSDVDFGLVSDTGTVENLIENGYTIGAIVDGKVPHNVVLDNIAWLD